MTASRQEIIKALDRVQAEYPGWSIWISDSGRPWATRRRAPLSDDELAAGLAMTVTPNGFSWDTTPDQLVGLLEEQAAAENRYRAAIGSAT